MNRIEITGRLTKDGEYRETEKVKVYAGSIAIQRNFKNKDGNYDADFFNFKLFSPSEKLLKYLKKGKSVAIAGRLQSRSYDDTDGNKKYITEIIVEHLELTGAKETSQEDAEIPQNTTTEYDTVNSDIQLDDSDLPF